MYVVVRIYVKKFDIVTPQIQVLSHPRSYQESWQMSCREVGETKCM